MIVYMCICMCAGQFVCVYLCVAVVGRSVGLHTHFSVVMPRAFVTLESQGPAPPGLHGP